MEPYQDRQFAQELADVRVPYGEAPLQVGYNATTRGTWDTPGIQQTTTYPPAGIEYTPYRTPTTNPSGTSGGALLNFKHAGRCTDYQHYFECRHEQVCDCGKTSRVTVADGL